MADFYNVDSLLENDGYIERYNIPRSKAKPEPKPQPEIEEEDIQEEPSRSFFFPFSTAIIMPLILIGTMLFGVVVGQLPFVRNFLFVRKTLMTEKQFISPLLPGKAMVIRNDRYGRGEFGTKRNGGRKHRGVDLKAKVGAALVSTKSGVVIKSEHQRRGMGHYITVEHYDKTQALYGHLSDRYVQVGEKVRQGQIIGSVGKSGNAFNKDMQTHVHFELWVDDKAVDPMPFLTRDHS